MAREEHGKTLSSSSSQHLRLRWLARARDSNAKSLAAMSFLPLETLEENVTKGCEVLIVDSVTSTLDFYGL